MRILIYSANFAPESTGIGKYSGEMAAWLVDRGHEVRVVAAPPYYPAWKVDKAYRRPLYRREVWQGVDVWRAPLWVPKAPGGLTRILHLLSFAISSFPVMIRQIFWRPDVVLTVAPAFVCAPAGLLTARLSRAQAWLHLQDFEVDVAFQMSLLKGKLLQRIILRMESSILRRFDTVSSISSRMVERLLTKGVSPERTRYFPNWVDISRIRPGSARGAFRDELGLPSTTLIALFSGSLGGKQGLLVIPEAAALLRERQDIVFVICGDGLMRPQLEQAAALLPNLILLPLQPYARLAELLSTADVHLLTQSPDAADLVLPSKLSGMLASGRPVIATCLPETGISEIVSQCGLVVAPNDGPALAAAIVTLADDPQQRLSLGATARAYAEANFERHAVMRNAFASLQSDLDDGLADDVVA